MSGPYDDALKRLVNENKQDFAEWVIQGKQVRIIANSRRATEFKRTTIADAIIDVEINGKPALLHFEFQADNDEDVPMRVLGYHYQARREYNLPVSSTVIYLKKHKHVPQSPLNWPFPEEEDMLSFRYRVIELAKLSADELRETGLTGLLPLMILTKGGATRKIAEEILTDLESANMEDSLLTAQMLIALVFSGKRAADREWLRKKWNLMSNKLRDNWFYQEITEEAREEGREEERKLREEERKQEMERLRQMLFSFVQARFADRKMELQARGQAALIDDPRILQKLILKVGLAQTAEEAQDYLLSWPELEQEAS